MDLLYKAEIRGGSLVVSLEQKGSKRILYLDTLKTIAKESDKEALSLLVKIHLAAVRNPETASFQRIVIPPSHRAEVLKLMAKTGRLSGDLPFLKSQEEVPLQVFPKLVLQDASGCFANLFMDYGIGEIAFDDFSPTIQGRNRLKKEEAAWEKDLLESGFTKKVVATSNYYVSSDKVKSALRFLLEMGWNVHDLKGRKVQLQTDLKAEVQEENEAIVVTARVQFGQESGKFNGKTWIELSEKTVGFCDQPLEIQGVWKEERLILKKTQIGTLLPYLEKGAWDEKLKELALGIKEGAVLSQPSADFRGELLSYQQKGVDWLSFLYRFGFSALLADEMGLGKTVQVLAFLSRLPDLPVLIVAPTSLLFNWKAEINRFLPGRKNIAITSYTQLRLNEKQYTEKEFEVIVLDESNAIKTATTQTAKAAYALKGKFKIALSGTPMENRIEELLSQFQFLMPNLIDREDLKQKIRPFILRRRKEEVQIDLPEKVEQTVWIEMSEEETELYESYRKGTHENRMQMLETILRLRQICCDPRLVGSSLTGAKCKQLVIDIQEALDDGRKILVFSQFTSMLRLIAKEFPDALYLDGETAAEKRGELVTQFQQSEGSCLFLLSLKAGGVGLNLTAADYVFLFDPWWNQAVEKQAIDRAHRIGQKKSLFVKRYLTVNKIEERMLKIKEKKQAAADELIDSDEGGWSEADLLYLLES